MTSTREQASRINGAKSQGPKTEEGKAASSQNALRHGLASRAIFPLSTEDDARWQTLLEGFVEEFQPQTARENELVVEMAGSRWRLRRLWAIESAQFEIAIESQFDDLTARAGGSLSNDLRNGFAFQKMASEHALPLAIRYERSIRRSYERALAELQTSQKSRASHPEEQAPQETTERTQAGQTQAAETQAGQVKAVDTAHPQPPQTNPSTPPTFMPARNQTNPTARPTQEPGFDEPT